MNKYSILEVSREQEDFDPFNTTYEEVRDSTIRESTARDDLLKYFVMGLNNKIYMGTNFFFVVDNEKQEILNKHQ